MGFTAAHAAFTGIPKSLARLASEAVPVGPDKPRLDLSADSAARKSFFIPRPDASEPEYHYGLALQALLALRMVFGERNSIDLTAREYFVSNVAANRGGRDNIVRVDASYTLRIKRQHALTIKYLGNRRDGYFPDLGTRTQARATIGIFYTYLGQDGFGTFDWN